MLGLVIGIMLANVLPDSILKKMKNGSAFTAKYLLKIGIILAGGTLNFKAVLGIGLSALPLILFNICLSFFTAGIIGKAMRISGNTITLVGGGTAICGGTAIATLSPIVNAKEEETAYAMAAIFLFDIFAAILWPYAAKAMALSPSQYGILGGLAISDTSSVVAAGATFDALVQNSTGAASGMETLSGGNIAVIIKLTRTVMLVLVAVCVMLANMIRNRTEYGENGNNHFVKRAARAFPLFVLGFLVMAVLNTAVDFSGIHLLQIPLSSVLSNAYKFFITTALVGVGLKIKLKSLLTEGIRPLLLGGCTWLAVAMSTLSYVLFFV